jgi:pre-rRNA-processing protein IPI3
MRQSTLARPLRKPFACIASPDATIFSPYMLVHVYIILHFERSDREMGKGNGSDEVLVVCSDRNMGTGIAMWDMETGDRIMHIPTCASPLHGLLCLRDQFLVASQVNKHGSVGGGAIFTWSLNKVTKPQNSFCPKYLS